MTMTEHPLPTAAEIAEQLDTRSNWGRWGEDDQRGAVNLITPERTVNAAGLVRSGRTVSLAREFPKVASPANKNPAEHRLSRVKHQPPPRGAAVDYYGIWFHGLTSTHLDALCHVWDTRGMWNGRDPDQELSEAGSRWAGVEQFKDGIVTRGVLLDVPRHRGVPYVEQDRPVHGRELAEIAETQGIELRPGDALAIHCGREAYSAAKPEWGAEPAHPGLHGSCLKFLRDADCSVLVWDMMELAPTGYEPEWAVHAALFMYGIAFLDNALLTPLAEACADEGRYEFMLVAAPLHVVGGTGSPVNPIAVF
jgi:kynurenine formamidase